MKHNKKFHAAYQEFLVSGSSHVFRVCGSDSHETVLSLGIFHGGMDDLNDTCSGYGTLESAIGSSATTFSVDDEDFGMFEFPSPDFFIKIGDEVMKVTNVNDHTFTVLRAQKGTSAVAHAADADVRFYTGEDYYLGNPPDSCNALNVKNSEGEVLAYVDEHGEVRYRGMLLPTTSLP